MIEPPRSKAFLGSLSPVGYAANAVRRCRRIRLHKTRARPFDLVQGSQLGSDRPTVLGRVPSPYSSLRAPAPDSRQKRLDQGRKIRYMWDSVYSFRRDR